MSTYPCPYCERSFSDGGRLRKHFANKRTCNEARRHQLQEQAAAARRDLEVLHNQVPSPRQYQNHAARSGGPSVDPPAIDIDMEPAGHEHNPVGNNLNVHEEGGCGAMEVDPPAVEEVGPDNPRIDGNLPEEPPPEPSQYTRRRQHGYATVEVHKTAARVIRWEYVDDEDEPSAADVLKQREWFQLGEWLAGLPISDSQRAEYFEIERHVDGSPWKNFAAFRKSVNALKRGPEWTEDTVTVQTNQGSETLVVLKRDPVAIVRHLIGLTRLRDHMGWGPEKHFTTTIDGRRIRVYSEMWTGEWWWRMQELLGEGVTIAPLIIATDQTNLTKLSGSKVAWPVYATIGNIRKAVRRRPSEHATMLIGYIPVAKLAWITNDKERCQKKWELFHASMAMILEPLKEVSRTGVEMRCADGGVRLVYPIIAAHVGDWPEQATAGCTSLTRCPVCISPFKERGDLGPPAQLRTKSQTLQAIRLSLRGYAAMQVGLGLRAMLPYWWDHPWSSGPGSLQPDILHQLWKGMYLVHLFGWWRKLLGDPKLDARYKGLPMYSGHRHFKDGISALTQWTGNEARATARGFLPIVAGETTHKAVRAARGIMDFTFRARMPQMDDDDLRELETDLAEFHNNKQIFRDKGVQTSRFGFNGISKLHILRHYTHLIRQMGAPDNFSTEGPERLHIDYVKVHYARTSHVDPEPQMTQLLEEQEAWDQLRYELEDEGVIGKKRRRARAEEEPIDDASIAGDEEEDDDLEEGDDEYGEDGERASGRGNDARRGLWVSDDGNWPRGELGIRSKEHEVFQFRFVPRFALRPPSKLQGVELCRKRHHQFMTLTLDFVKEFDENLAFKLDETTFFGVWTRFSLTHDYLPFAPLVGRHVDLVHASPSHRTRRGRIKPAHFDTVLLNEFPDRQGLLRYRAARVRVIFQLPSFCHYAVSEPLALVELFKPFDPNVSAVHRLVTVEPLIRGGQRVCKVIPASQIHATCQLVAQYSSLDPTIRITADTDLLSIAPRFYLGRHSTYYFFSVMDHWRRMMWR